MYGLLNAHRSEQAAETGWVWRLANRQKNTIACIDLTLGRGVLFNETIFLYVPARVGIGVLYFQSFQASVARTCARVCTVNVNHEEALMQPCKAIGTVTGLYAGVRW